MKSIAFFNNKGGVGKTTLAANAASYFAKSLGLATVVIDCDPQANATQLLLDDDHWEAIYEDRETAEKQSILKALSHIRAGDSTVDTEVSRHSATRFGVRVVAGHPTLSILEDQLSSSWVEFQGGRVGGARRSLWARELVSALARQGMDVAVFDLGPSLGALNRTVLLSCDHFITPVAADLFSLYALDNIGSAMSLWLREYEEGVSRIARSQPGVLDEYGISATLPIAHGYVGYTVQQYVTKTTAGRVRRVAAYDKYRRQIPDRARALSKLRTERADPLELGVVPNMFSMVPLAQTAHAPIRDLRTSDGVRGAQVTQQENYVRQLDEIFGNLAKCMGLL